jgi:predicted O-methyltransferase YrrM
MYSPFQLAKKYAFYYLSSSNGNGHAIHSPFVFDFIKNVLNAKMDKAEYQAIENLRISLRKDRTVIEVEDFGAGSSVTKSTKRTIADIARHAGKSGKYGQLLFRIARHYQPKTILELGSSLGLSTSYLAMAVPGSMVVTLEGSTAVAAMAKENFKNLGLSNVNSITGEFGATLSKALTALGKTDLVFLDGNHRKAPTLAYFNLLLQYADPYSILVFDDIHWSAEMEDAWAEIKQHPAVTMTIDLFFLGLVFFRKDFRVTQHFTIRF